MKSRSKSRTDLEDQPKSTPGEIHPGDQVLFEIETQLGDLTNQVWGYVIKKRGTHGELCVVVDEQFICNGTAGISRNDVVRVKPGRVVAVIEGEKDKTKPVVHVVLQDGVVTDMRRVDGETAPIIVILDDQDHGTKYLVDHKGGRRVTD